MDTDRRCPHCGTELPAVVDAFCPFCGEPFEEPVVANDHPVRLPAHFVRNGHLLGAFYLSAVFYGIHYVLSWQSTPVYLLLAIFFNLVLTWWVTADAVRRGQPIPTFSKSWIFLFAPLVAPAYVIWTRGWRGVGLLLIHAVAWYALSLATYLLTATIVFAG